MPKFYGSDLRAYFRTESAFGTAVLPTAATALRVTEATFERPEGRAIPNDRRGTRSRMARTAARQPPIAWTLSGIFRPSDALGTAPEMGDLIKHAMGKETVSASTSVAYTLLKDMTVGALDSPGSATILAYQGDVMAGCSGAIVQSLAFSWSGEDYITWTASGEAQKYIEGARDLANGAGASATSLIVDDADNYRVGTVLEIVDDTTEVSQDDGSGAGLQVTAVNYTTNTLTITPAATWSDNDRVIPFAPAGTFVGTELFGVDGSVSLDGGSSTLDTTGGSVTINTGLSLLNSSFGQTQPEEILNNGMREVTCNIDFIADTTNTYLGKEMARKTAYDVQIILGDTAASRVKINMDNVEFDPGAYDSPEEDVVRWSSAGIALGTSGEDEIDLMFD